MVLDKPQESGQNRLEYLGRHTRAIRLSLGGLIVSLVNREDLVINMFNHSLTITSSKQGLKKGKTLKT